jgi:predicted DNA-binding transcriptional regulator YafY
VRAGRLLSLLLLLQVGRSYTADELAERLGVSVRTIYRDVDALVEAGVPLRAERGPAGGYALRRGYRTNLTGLTPEEAEALFAAGIRGPAAELGIGEVLATAQLKLLASLPDELRERAEHAAAIFHVDAPRWFRRREEPPHLAELARAAWDDRRVRIRYRRRGDIEEHVVDPLGLVAKAGAWYLVGTTDTQGPRVYRVLRIEHVDVLDERFERPREFDLASYWQDSSAAFERGLASVDVTVRVRARSLPALRAAADPRALPAIDAVAPRTRGWLELTIPFERLEYAYTTLLGLGPEVEVLAPASLRRRMTSAARGLARRYAVTR